MEELLKMLDVQQVRVETRQRDCQSKLAACEKDLERVKRLQKKYIGARDTLLELEKTWNSKTRIVS